MKKLIWKWLGIPNINYSKYITRDDVSEVVVRALYEAFKLKYKTPSYKYYLDWGDVDLRGTLEDIVREQARLGGRQAAIEKLGEIIEREKFIDDVVQRIKLKQIK